MKGGVRRLAMLCAAFILAFLFPALKEGPEGARAMQSAGVRLFSAPGDARRGASEIKGLVSRVTNKIRLHGGDARRVGEEEARRLREILKPGDIVLTRSDWFVSNIGIPGYWTHSALFVGGGAGGDSVEAIDRGVSLSSFMKIAHADSIAVVRPLVEEDARAGAVGRALASVGTPYDFDFDFSTDGRLACSELIYKAYGADAGGNPLLPLKMGRVMGNPFASPAELGRLVLGGRAELVAYVDARPGGGGARRLGLTEFAASLAIPGGSGGPLAGLLK